MPEDATMSFTIVKDDGQVVGVDFGSNDRTVLHIRATISTRTEVEELIAKLNRRLDTDFAQEEKTSEHNARSVCTDAAATLPHIFDSAGR
jgi:hypothetical protein